jgi:O-antigen ligase
MSAAGADLRYQIGGNGRGPRQRSASDLLIVVGAVLLAASLPLMALRFLSLKPGLFPFLVLGVIAGAYLLRNPGWIIPGYIGLVWMSIDASYFGGLPSPIETAGFVLLAFATWQALFRLEYAREVLVVCALIGLPLLIAGLLSPEGTIIPMKLYKDLSFLFLIALCVRTIADVDRAAIILAVTGIFLGAGSMFSVFVHPTRLFPLLQPTYQFQVIPPRAAGPIGDPNFFALVLAALVPFALYLVARGGRRQLLGIASALVLIGGVFATGSRGGLLAIAVAIVGAGIIMPVPRLRLAAAAVVLCGFIALPLFATQRQDAATRSTTGRLTENLVAAAMFQDHPVTGIGPEQYPGLYRDYTREIGNDPRPVREAHSLPLQIAAEQGTVGIVGWAVALLTVFRFAWVRGVWELLLGRAVMLSITTYLIASLFLHGDELRVLYLLLGLLLALGYAVPREKRALGPA